MATKDPNTLVRVISKKSGIATFATGKDAALYPEPLLVIDTFDRDPEIVATAVAPEPDLVVPLSFGRDA